jgi:hypothetical protein
MKRTRKHVTSASFENEVEPPAVTVVQTVAEAASVDERDLEPLEHVLPVDALNRLVSESDAHLEFDYEGYAVDVTDDGVTVYTSTRKSPNASDD